MKIIQFKMKNDKPLFVNLDQIDWWLESVDNSNHTEIQINGGKLYLGNTVAEVTKLIEEA